MTAPGSASHDAAHDPAHALDLDRLLASAADDGGGQVDDSIPQLAETDPSLAGIALVTPDGRTHAAGTARAPSPSSRR
ncbi:glutaminase [Clavibacter michiganensis subsp. michiganensis]|uniref:Glutaminase n=1 Tax=Clavibacter michiganensis subsp. michiganensis TaxID=33013 RepID=A0A251XM58_CLAMM|nr:glutaminase [Clavibacter michiganensis subsp. michiganensis]OUE04480.1 glutaminase [Clavibacter michiganensis subsp. michiganensis]